MILQYQKYQIGLGTRRVYGILFDGAWLWDEYINLLVKDFILSCNEQRRSGAQSLFSDNIGLIYPDFISKDNKKRIIADAKYKPVDNIGNCDYLQVVAYMFRFDAKIGMYFYPENMSAGKLKYMLNSGTIYENNVKPSNDVCIMKIRLQIPESADSYSDFAEKWKNQKMIFISVFLIINNCYKL